jgi:cysteinyl-tRNA synthetase
MVGPVIFDTVKRYLTYLGYKVKWVVNVTDVDDKLINRAKELNTTVPALAEQMTQDYFACLKALNVTGIDAFPRATQHIGGMINVIKSLEAKGYAYELDDGVYFDVSKDEDYGKLSNRDPEQMEAGARLEPNARKRNPGDFALWKCKPGEPAEVQFDSPFKCGRGRPGWHIECTCMAVKELGETLDIHGGGLDLQFPHHENELAQSESWTGKPFARVWMHNGLLKLKDKEGKDAKMAGSLGNVLNVADALKHIPGEVLRFFMLKTHYRTPIDLGIWDWKNPATPIPEGMVEARNAYQTFVRFAESVQRITGKSFAELAAPTKADEPRSLGTPNLEEAYMRFRSYMDDDFNTGGAIGVLFELVNDVNRIAHEARLEEAAGPSPQRAEFIRGATLVKEMTQVLGLTFAKAAGNLLSAITGTMSGTLAGLTGQATGEVRSVAGVAHGTSTAVASANVVLSAEDFDRIQQRVSGLVELLLDLRNNLRAAAKEAAKDNPLKKSLFDQTDLIRKRLGELGVTLEDRPGGTTWRVG